jgi:hypothetical protein
MTITATQITSAHGSLPPTAMQVEHKAKDAEAEFTFDDFIDIINPLHHIPVVSTIYRALSGDQISVHARAIGGGVYGGPLGLLSAGVAMAAEEAIGMSPEGLLASIFSSDDPAAKTMAGAQPPLPANTALQATQAKLAATPPPEQASLPFTAKKDNRFFAIQNAARTSMPFQSRASQTPTSNQASNPAGAGALSPSQNALLERFVSGAENSSGARPIAGLNQLTPPTGATAEWFASRMQANLEKYAATQASADQARARPVN